MADSSTDEDLSPNDRRLVEETIRRLQALRPFQQVDHDLMKAALAKEIARGRRDLFSLTRAGQRALDNH